ncbi:2521_t:CDS:1, partial [Cetraspora pellucida]
TANIADDSFCIIDPSYLGADLHLPNIVCVSASNDIVLDNIIK